MATKMSTGELVEDKSARDMELKGMDVIWPDDAMGLPLGTVEKELIREFVYEVVERVEV